VPLAPGEVRPSSREAGALACRPVARENCASATESGCGAMAKLTTALEGACCAMAGAAAPSMAVTARAETDHRTCRQDVRFPEELDTTEEPLDRGRDGAPCPP
jgi:hypothetical protein